MNLAAAGLAILAAAGTTFSLCQELGYGATTALLAVALLGGMVGVSEIVSRYADSPGQALLTRAGIAYIVVNVIAASAAFGLAHGFDLLGLASKKPEDRLLTESLVAGFGAMAFFRSAVFTARVGNSDIGVGPASVLQLIMNAVDRACDRARAQPRAEFISRLMSDVSFAAAADVLPQFCFSAMQNVSASDQQAIQD